MRPAVPSTPQHRTRLLPIVIALLSLAACDGGAEVEYGPAQLRLVSGMDQPTTAVRDSLDLPVAVQLFQAPQSPGIALRLVPRLHAQGSLRGLEGKVLTAEGIGDNPLVPWNAAAVTDEHGVARFNFNPGTKAAPSCAEVRAPAPVVPDTVCVNVAPGPLASWTVVGGHLFIGGSLDLRTLVSGAADVHGNAIPAPELTATLENPANFVLSGTTLTATDETASSVRLSSGQVEAWSHVRALRDLRQHAWRVQWGCQGVRMPSGERADSTRHALEVSSVTYGQMMQEGITVVFHGTQRDSVWSASGLAVTERPQAARTGYQSHFSILWSRDNPDGSLRGTLGYVGGSLCEGTLGDDYLASSLVRVVRL